jgi:hypothetical protein
MKHINAMSVEQLCCIGADVKYGLYSMYGARAGMIHAFCNVLDECKNDPKLVTPKHVGDYVFMDTFVKDNLAVIQKPEELQMILDFDWYHRTAAELNISLRDCTVSECQLYRLIVGMPVKAQQSLLEFVDPEIRSSYYFVDGWWDENFC